MEESCRVSRQSGCCDFPAGGEMPGPGTRETLGAAQLQPLCSAAQSLGLQGPVEGRCLIFFPPVRPYLRPTETVSWV